MIFPIKVITLTHIHNNDIKNFYEEQCVEKHMVIK